MAIRSLPSTAPLSVSRYQLSGRVGTDGVAQPVTFRPARVCVASPALPRALAEEMDAQTPAPDSSRQAKTNSADDPVYGLGTTLFEALTGNTWIDPVAPPPPPPFQ